MGTRATAAGLWAEAFRVERRGIDPLAALAGGVATCAPLALGIALDEPAIGVMACFGGLNGALVVPRATLRERVGWGLGASLLCTLSVAVGTAVQASPVASAAVAVAWVALAAFLRTFGPAGGLTGFITAAILVIANGIPAEDLGAGSRALAYAAGSAVGLALMAAALARGAPLPAPDRPPLREALAGGVRRYRDALTGDRVLRAHAVRLSLLVAATVLVYQLLGLAHGYWVPVTVLAVLQPDEHASSVRAVQRAAGTLVGTAAIAAITIASGGHWVLVVCQGIAAVGLFALFARSYFWLVVLLTPTALLTISAVDYQGPAIALERAGWSALGIILGLGIAELVWRRSAIARGPDRAVR